jgi:glutamate-1-semialdehyde 2,1-aminomutase
VRDSGLPAQVVGEFAVFDVVFTDQPVTDYRSMLTADGALMRAFNAECLKRGVLKGGQKIYMSLAHTAEDLSRTLEVFGEALAALPRRRSGAGARR